jgi:hypothetical protein
MVKIDKEKWLVGNSFDAEVDCNEDAWLIDSNTNSPLEISRIQLDGNSISKYLMEKLKK